MSHWIEHALLPWISLDKLTMEIWKNPHSLTIPFGHYLLSLKEEEQSRSSEHKRGISTDDQDQEETHIHSISWPLLCQNHSPQAIDYITKALQQGQITESMLNWYWLSGNPFAVDLLLSKPNHIHWYMLYKNPSAVSLIRERILNKQEEEVHQSMVCLNPRIHDIYAAIDIPFHLVHCPTLSANPDPYYTGALIGCDINHAGDIRIHPNWFSTNTNPDAIRFITEHWNDANYEWNWAALSANPAAVDLLYAHRDKIVWEALSANPNPRVLPLLEANPTQIHWNALSANPCIFV